MSLEEEEKAAVGSDSPSSEDEDEDEEVKTNAPDLSEELAGADVALPQGEPVLLPASVTRVAYGETNGGPLGCCLGVVAGLFLTALIMLSVSVALSNGGYLSFATLPLFLLGAAICGYFGWRIGKRIYREYEQPVLKDRRKQPNRRLGAQRARRV
jgi:hypothetical protein